MKMTRAIIANLLMVVLALLLVGGASIIKAEPVYACTWSTEHVNTASKQFWSGYLGVNDTLYTRITTYAGGAGVGCANYKYYRSEQWTLYGTPGSFHTVVRHWVCGTAYPTVSSSIYYVDSGSNNYGLFCGRQADNQGTYFHDNYDNVNVSQYVTQG